jgi:hypothetical protein
MNEKFHSGITQEDLNTYWCICTATDHIHYFGKAVSQVLLVT